nr:MAG TPA: hypothetical protein [Caudoviricetes sp.]
MSPICPHFFYFILYKLIKKAIPLCLYYTSCRLNFKNII